MISSIPSISKNATIDLRVGLGLGLGVREIITFVPLKASLARSWEVDLSLALSTRSSTDYLMQNKYKMAESEMPLYVLSVREYSSTLLSGVGQKTWPP